MARRARPNLGEKCCKLKSRRTLDDAVGNVPRGEFVDVLQPHESGGGAVDVLLGGEVESRGRCRPMSRDVGQMFVGIVETHVMLHTTPVPDDALDEVEGVDGIRQMVHVARRCRRVVRLIGRPGSVVRS